MYQDMLDNASTREEAEIIQVTLDTMKQQLYEIENDSIGKGSPKKDDV